MQDYVKSRPARGAWIEMVNVKIHRPAFPRRAPRGARGLKFHIQSVKIRPVASRPARGAWIEIKNMTTWDFETIVAPREGRVD